LNIVSLLLTNDRRLPSHGFLRLRLARGRSYSCIVFFVFLTIPVIAFLAFLHAFASLVHVIYESVNPADFFESFLSFVGYTLPRFSPLIDAQCSH